jgi:hypothetical protein
MISDKGCLKFGKYRPSRAGCSKMDAS